jgi:hypothetical protein
MHIRSLLSVIVILVVVALACLAAPTETSVPPSHTPPAATLTPPPESPQTTLTIDPSRYLNSEGGFSLKLTEGWTVLGPLPIDSDPDRPYNLYVLGLDPASSGGPDSSKIAILDPLLWTPEEFALSQCSTCPENPFEQVTLGGKPAQRTQVGGGGVPFMITWYFVENNGKLIALDFHDPETLDPLDEVIQSIQFHQ